jgi:preprotein translocase subunit SecD
MFTRRALLVAAGLTLALPAVADDAPKARVEFRRAETAPAPGLTEAVVAGTKDKVYLHKAADLTGADVASAKVGGTAGARTIDLTFTPAGGKKLAKVSEEHADKPLAVVVDGRVLAAPVIRARLGTSVLISGQFTEEEASKLAKAVGGR